MVEFGVSESSNHFGSSEVSVACEATGMDCEPIHSIALVKDKFLFTAGPVHNNLLAGVLRDGAIFFLCYLSRSRWNQAVRLGGVRTRSCSRSQQPPAAAARC